MAVQFIPNKKQARFLASNADICLMGGGVASGKTLASIFLILRMNETPIPGFKHPKYNAIIFRKHYKDLRDIIQKTKDWYPLIDRGAKYNASEMIWTFSSGARVQIAHFDSLDSCTTMVQGSEYTTAIQDEAMHWETDEVFKYVMSRLRNTFGMQTQMRLTSNPGKYKWLREFFRIDNIGTSTKFDLEFELQDGTKEIKKIEYIQAKLSDNPYIPKSYEATLMMMNEDEKAALLFGRWDVYNIKGSIYCDQIAEMRKENKICKVPHDPALTTYCVFDLGRNDHTPIIFAQVFGKEIRIFDHYENDGQHISHYFQQVKSRNLGDVKIILPHDAKAKRIDAEYSVEEQANTMFGSNNVTVLAAESIELGISEAKLMMKNLYIHEDCKRLLECLENYKRKYNASSNMYMDPIHDEFSDTADAFRYLAMYLKLTTNVNKFIPPPQMPFMGIGHSTFGFGSW